MSDFGDFEKRARDESNLAAEQIKADKVYSDFSAQDYRSGFRAGARWGRADAERELRARMDEIRRTEITNTNRLVEKITELETELAGFRAPMACGHPQACWTTGGGDPSKNESVITYYSGFSNPTSEKAKVILHAERLLAKEVKAHE